MTKAIIDLAASLGISVHDHIIVGKAGHARSRGMEHDHIIVGKNGHASLKGMKLI
jgi:DNA repair protein RadC